MSYDEVERGLPPVHISSTPIWIRHRPQLPLPQPEIEPTPDHECNGNESDFSIGTITSIPTEDPIPIRFEDDDPPNHTPPTPPRYPSTQRYIIQDDDNEMKVFKVEPNPTDSKRSNIPNNFYISGAGQPIDMMSEADEETPANQTACASRFQQFCSFILYLLPVIFFVLAFHLIKFMMNNYSFHLIGLCIFPPILCSGVLFVLLHRFWFKIPIFQILSCSNENWKNWIELLVRLHNCGN